jgi:hypothetical protein
MDTVASNKEKRCCNDHHCISLLHPNWCNNHNITQATEIAKFSSHTSCKSLWLLQPQCILQGSTGRPHETIMADDLGSPPPPPTSELANGIIQEQDVIKGPAALPKFLLLLEEFGFPPGMFPLRCVEEFGFDRSSGRWWLWLKTRCEQEFQSADSMVFCEEQMSGRIQKGKILDLNGWKMKPIVHKTLYLSVNYRELWVDDDTTFGKIHFKDCKGFVQSFPLQAFFPMKQ